MKTIAGIIRCIIAVSAILIAGCGPPDSVSSPGTLLFRSGFEGNVAVSDMDIAGSDGMDWQKDLERHEAVSGFWLYNGGDQSFADLRADPADSDNRCLYMQVDGGNRMQCELNFKDSADYPQVYVRYRVLWPGNLGNLSQYPERIGWFTFLEVWEHHNPDEPGDQAGKARWTFSFFKDQGVGEPLYWGLDAQGAQPDWHDLWSEENRDIPIPFGKWSLFEILFKRGKGENGRIWIAITPEDGEKQVIFDLRRDTKHPVNPMPLRSFQLWKLYTRSNLVAWMAENHQPISAYYDDFEWWTDIP
ncbi:hypothetical protein ACFLT7_00495 [candidate division KSB1 bacterium]